MLLKGSRAAGYRTDLWTLKRVAAMIQRDWGVPYHPCHVWKLLVSHGWSCQNPERRALQRDDAAIAHWKRSRWPHIKKRRATWRLAVQRWMESGVSSAIVHLLGP